MPSNTLEKNLGKDGLTEQILAIAKLDAVISMPANLFAEQGRTVKTSIFVFTKTPHNRDDTTLFYNLDDDGLESIPHRGRQDTKNRWGDIERNMVQAVQNNEEIAGVSLKQRVMDDAGNIEPSGHALAGDTQVARVSDLFTIEVGSLQSSKNDETGAYTFVTAADERKRHTFFEYDEEALVYAVSAGGSLGKCQYVSGKFIASNLCLVLRPKEDAPYINLRFYRHYFEAKRKEIVADLARGAAKQTINKDAFKNYPIEVFSEAVQDQFVTEHVVPTEKLATELSEATIELKSTMHSAITDPSQALCSTRPQRIKRLGSSRALGPQEGSWRAIG